MQRENSRPILIAASGVFLALAPATFAAPPANDTGGGAQGVTSGPAVHSNAVPATAVEKHAYSGNTTSTSGMKTAGAGAAGAGAPGVAAKSGTEGGTQPQGGKAQ